MFRDMVGKRGGDGDPSRGIGIDVADHRWNRPQVPTASIAVVAVERVVFGEYEARCRTAHLLGEPGYGILVRAAAVEGARRIRSEEAGKGVDATQRRVQGRLKGDR